MAHEPLVACKCFCSGNPTGSFHCGHPTKVKGTVLLWRPQLSILLFRWIFISKSWRLPFRKGFFLFFIGPHSFIVVSRPVIFIPAVAIASMAGQAWSSFRPRDEKDVGLCCLELSAQGGGGNLQCRGKAEKQTQHLTSEQNMQLDSLKMSLAGRRPFTFKSI